MIVNPCFLWNYQRTLRKLKGGHSHVLVAYEMWPFLLTLSLVMINLQWTFESITNATEQDLFKLFVDVVRERREALSPKKWRMAEPISSRDIYQYGRVSDSIEPLLSAPHPASASRLVVLTNQIHSRILISS
jgi:hypothetical protein